MGRGLVLCGRGFSAGRMIKCLFILALPWVAAPALAAEPAPPAGHCRADEVVFFNSRMGTLDWNSRGTRKILKGEKLLSLCADRFPGMKRLDMRFGKPGAVELAYSSDMGRYRLAVQPLEGTLSWSTLAFDLKGYRYALVEPSGEGATDVFLVISRDDVPLMRTDAIDETDHWLHYPKKVGKKRKATTYVVAAALADIPAAVAQIVPVGLDPKSLEKARYKANFSMPK